ncbi:MAG: prenyltransferase [Spirochaetales bacterium]|nr:prenyltransferase [Spirochaetales bacterium]
MGTFLAGSLFAAVNKGDWFWSRFVIMGLAVLFIDMGTTGFNSYYDFVRGTDTANYNLEKDKVLVHEGVTPGIALFISIVLFAAAGVLGLILAWKTSWLLLAVGGVCMAVGYSYTGGPYPISRTPFGELFAGGFLGTVLFMISYYSQALTISPHVLIASIPFFLLIAMILTVNNTCDRISDKAAGRRTLSILLSEQITLNVMQIMMMAAFGLGIIFAMTGLYPIAALPLISLARLRAI